MGEIRECPLCGADACDEYCPNCGTKMDKKKFMCCRHIPDKFGFCVSCGKEFQANVGRGGKREGAGRPTGSIAKIKRKTSTISIFPDAWEFLDDLGPSRGKAVEKLIEFWEGNKAN